MGSQVMHQFTEGLYLGDAVSDHILLIQRWLQEMGYASQIFATKIEKAFEDVALPVQDYHQSPGERCLIYHHAVGSDTADWLMSVDLPQILIYHNITPPEYYQASNPALSAQLLKGRKQLEQMRPQTILALADSAYNEQELLELGYDHTAVLPIVLQESNYNLPIDKKLASRIRARKPTLLFVGRFAPNKKQEDLITLLYYYQRLQPGAQLILVGSLQDKDYVSWLGEYARSLGLTSEDVIFAGHVSQQALVTYYSSADLYISMSEHEGFGKPLIESMYHGLPVMAFASSAVPYTMGDAGILFFEKKYEAIAEAIDIVLVNKQLRERVVQRQNARLQAFLESNVRQTWQNLVQELHEDLSKHY